MQRHKKKKEYLRRYKEEALRTRERYSLRARGVAIGWEILQIYNVIIQPRDRASDYLLLP